jgi:threonine dehydrogenase-like Zn-dependent dehydrogenase
MCTGATTIQLDIPKSNIPLDVALCGDKLRSFVRPTDRVVVFGTAHSGTLIMRNLKNVGCTNVTAVYKNEKPVSWARDGDTEGIKQESASIADEIVAGAWGPYTPSLVRLDTATCGFLRSLMEADHVIYGIGFQTRAPVLVDAAGAKIDPATYSAENGKLRDGLWGFGIGFPSKYTTPGGRQASDVGFGPFAAHILKSLPAIL